MKKTKIMVYILFGCLGCSCVGVWLNDYGDWAIWFNLLVGVCMLVSAGVLVGFLFSRGIRKGIFDILIICSLIVILGSVGFQVSLESVMDIRAGSAELITSSYELEDMRELRGHKYYAILGDERCEIPDVVYTVLSNDRGRVRFTYWKNSRVMRSIEYVEK